MLNQEQVVLNYDTLGTRENYISYNFIKHVVLKISAQSEIKLTGYSVKLHFSLTNTISFV